MATLQNERGAALITALVILVLLTIIGIAATNTSMLETMISATEKNHAEAFYAAEAGIEHLRRNLQSLYQDGNSAKIAAGMDPDWDFALAGPDGAFGSGDDASGTSFLTGARWITDGDLGGNYRYNVTIWNNDDGGDAVNDEDQNIYVRADASVPGGGSASIEIMLKGSLTDSSAINDNNAQAGGGGGKNSSGNDVGAVDDFTRQLQ